MRDVKRASTASAIVRMLVKRVFTPEALSECSVSGKPSTKNGQVEVRPALNQDGVEAIIGMNLDLLQYIFRVCYLFLR